MPPSTGEPKPVAPPQAPVRGMACAGDPPAAAALWTRLVDAAESGVPLFVGDAPATTVAEVREVIGRSTAESDPVGVMVAGADALACVREAHALLPEMQFLILGSVPRVVTAPDATLLLPDDAGALEFTQALRMLVSRASGLRGKSARAAGRNRPAGPEESGARFAAAFRHGPMPLLLLTPDCGRVIDANERFLRFSGQRLSGLVGRPLEDTGVVAETREWRGLLLRLEGGRSVRDEPFAWFAGGARHETRLSAELLDIGGTPSVLVSFEDVTERRDLEHRLRQVQKMEAVGQLAAGVAHDFNNLLTVVEGYAGLLLGRADVAPDVRQDVRRIMQAAESASALTRKLLAFSRRQVVQPRPVRVNDHVLAMQDMLTRLIGERVEVRFEIGPGLPVVLGDPNGLEQVVLNLALNARDAMPDGGVVQIGTAMVEIRGTHAGGHPLARPGRFALLTVCDDGVGMDEATLARIFEPFFTTKEAGKGTGLGLASVYAIVQQHRGWIEVSSRPGQGTRFVVYLPLSEAGPEPSEARRPARETRGDATVLVVEDEETVRSLVRLVLGRAGYRVIEAANATAALEAWGTHARAIDLVLTDMIMPGAMTGIGLAAELRRHRPRLPVLFSSGYSPEIAGSEMVTEAVFLPKPYTPEMLLDKVAACLVPGPTASA